MKEERASFWPTVLQLPWIKGPLIGGSVISLLTPLHKWTNHALNNQKMPWKNPMSGALSYAASSIPSFAVTFSTKALLKRPPEESSKAYDFMTSFIAGGTSGFVCAPFQSVAQNKQLTDNPSNMDVIRKIKEHHGYQGFFQAASIGVLREGLWSVMFMSAIPVLSKNLQATGYKKREAEFISVMSIAGIFGLFSTPLNILRFKKQQDLTKPVPRKSYVQHIHDVLHQEATPSTARKISFFFKAFVPRTVNSIAITGLMFKANEFYDEATNRI